MIDKKKKKILLYDGDWSNEQFNGHGTYYYVNGNPWYVGQWKNNMAHGFGVLYNDNGSMMCRGYFENGEYKRDFGDATLFEIQPFKTNIAKITNAEKKKSFALFSNIKKILSKLKPKKPEATIVKSINPVHNIFVPHSVINIPTNECLTKASLSQSAKPIKMSVIKKTHFRPTIIKNLNLSTSDEL
jgi:hypothetical protein